MLKLIARLHRLERTWDEAVLTVPAERAQLRTAGFARALAWLHRLALALRARVLPKSLLRQACTCLLGHWTPLTAHRRHRQTRLDTNLVENAVRPSAVGNNWMFIGHLDAGQRSGILYSIVVSCQRHGKNPLGYLRDVLRRLPAMTNQDDLAALTPACRQPAS